MASPKRRRQPVAKRRYRLLRCRFNMYRYRLIDEETGSDIGPLISARLTFAIGEEISRGSGERYIVKALVEPENESFRAYIVVSGQ